MPTLVALYRGHRRPLSGLGPRATARDAALAAAEAFGIHTATSSPASTEDVRLRYRGVLLNPSDSLLVLNLPNNALLEVELSSTSASAPIVRGKSNVAGASIKAETVSISHAQTHISDNGPNYIPPIVSASPAAAKSGPEARVTVVQRDRSSVTLPLSVSTTLRQVLELFSEPARRDPAAQEAGAVPSGAVFMRRQYVTQEELQTTTLAALGLGPGMPGKIQLLYNDDNNNTGTSADIAVPSPPPITAPPLVPLEGVSSGAVSAVDKAMRLEPGSADSDSKATEPAMDAAEESLGNAVKFAMSHNFDAVTGPALILFAKYIINIVRYPNEEKYWSISTKNAVYSKRIAPLRGHERIFRSLGFHPLPRGRGGEAEAAWTASPSAQRRLDREHWEAAYKVLADAADSMGISDDFPALTAPAVLHGANSNSSDAAVAVPFDPFRAMVTRTSALPAAGNQTITSSTKILANDSFHPTDNASSRLEELARRRRELEGDVDAVERLTEIFFPNDLSGAQLRLRSGVGLDGEEPSDSASTAPALSREDARLMSQYVALKMKRGDPSEAPLMTEALRMLEKAKHEKVYSKCIVKIRFPDKVILQGFFHPRHSTKDIYDWVLGCVDTERLSISIEDIELYTTPPKTVLPLELREGNTLYELGMVPAVNMHCNFRAIDVSSERAITNGDEMKSIPDASPGWYLDISKVTAAQLNTAPDRSDQYRRSNGSFPTGVSLIPTSASLRLDTDGDFASGNGARGSSKRSEEADSKTPSEGRKPKWLKT